MSCDHRSETHQMLVVEKGSDHGAIDENTLLQGFLVLHQRSQQPVTAWIQPERSHQAVQ